ncbi:putative quinol monooxygenase, partial [Streptomyces albidoflavus]
MSFTVVARYRTLPGREDAVLSVLDQVAAASRQEPGCLGYRVHQGTEDPRAV